MSRGWKIFLWIAGVFVLGYVVLLVALLASAGDGVAWGSGSGTVGVIRLDGVISADSEPTAFSAGGIDPVSTVELLRSADEDPDIDAIVLRINSPGGSPAASWEIYQAVSEMQKPVVVSVADVAASGAYYFASPADVIMAAPTSEVGSIGVILMAQDLEGLLEKVGIRYTVLTRGEHKDIGSPARAMTDEEKRILQEQVDMIYERFIADVADGRPELDADQVRELATGLTYPGEEALRLGLIDELGSYSDALDVAADLAGLDLEDYGVTYLQPEFGADLLSLFLGVSSGALRQIGIGLAQGLTAPALDGARLRLE
ncbi:MAG: signal peptide peptidase SppA [Actinobacteria bacterium]|nr:signal peptide peptidase SppA [Actinomycetota bacterium]